METAHPIENPTPKLGTRHRWLGAVPMFVCFVLIALAPRIIQHFEALFSGTGARATIPILILFSFGRSIQTKPWLFTAFMFAVAWTYFGWVAKDRRRIIWFNGVVLTTWLLGTIFFFVALLSPF